MERSVLIVDDSEIVRRCMRRFFEHLPDWKIAGEASDGVKAVEIANKLEPDLIFLDLSMPGLNGIEAASLLRKALPHAFITIFTVFDNAIGSRLSPVAGVDLVLPKAAGLASLTKTVQGFNQHHRTAFDA